MCRGRSRVTRLRKDFAERAEADGEIGRQFVAAAAAHARRDAPGQELRVFADIGDEVEHLVRPVRDDLAFGVGGHQACVVAGVARAVVRCAVTAGRAGTRQGRSEWGRAATERSWSERRRDRRPGLPRRFAVGDDRWGDEWSLSGQLSLSCRSERGEIGVRVVRAAGQGLAETIRKPLARARAA